MKRVSIQLKEFLEQVSLRMFCCCFFFVKEIFSFSTPQKIQKTKNQKNTKIQKARDENCTANAYKCVWKT